MVFKRNKQQGVTLLETMLVLAIAATVVIMGLRMYQSFKLDQEIQQVKYNVDVIFQGLTNFYRANCIQYAQYKAAGVTTGVLDPDSSTTPLTDPYPIDIDKDLNNTKSAVFIPQWPFNPNALVDSSAGNNGYITQFNRSTQNRTVRMDTATPPTTNTVGTIYQWRAQVAVQISRPADAAMLRGVWDADCLSTASGKTVTPCSKSTTTICPASGCYAVWERLPSFATPETMTDLWPSMPTLDQFTQMYTTYPILDLTGSGSMINPAINQYYLCGG